MAYPLLKNTIQSDTYLLLTQELRTLLMKDLCCGIRFTSSRHHEPDTILTLWLRREGFIASRSARTAGSNEKVRTRVNASVQIPLSKNQKRQPAYWMPFQRRERDSNPRTFDSQRFSRPPQSTTLPSLRGQKYKLRSNLQTFILNCGNALIAKIKCYNSHFPFFFLKALSSFIHPSERQIYASLAHNFRRRETMKPVTLGAAFHHQQAAVL